MISTLLVLLLLFGLVALSAEAEPTYQPIKSHLYAKSKK